MDALEFLKAVKRRYESNPDEHFSAIYFDLPDLEAYVKDAEEWAKSNPPKTRQTEFIKMFPNVSIRRDGYIDIAPCNLDAEVYKKCVKGSTKCNECYKEFWGKEVE